METAKQKSVVIADELALMRDGVAAICELSQQYHVVAQCADGITALQQIVGQQPDLAVLDLSLSQLHTLELIRKLRNSDVQTKVVLLSARPDRNQMVEALRCGADAFLVKNCSSQHLLDAFHQVVHGGVYLSPMLALDDFGSARTRRRSDDPLSLLSSREYQVFTLLVDGVRAKEIAARLELSPKTVDTHRASLMRKLNIHDVAGLVKFAITRNLTSVA